MEQEEKPGINFEAFVKEYSDILYSYLARITGSGADAEDILQETLIKIAASLADLKDPSVVKTWAFRIATNTAMDLFRKNGKYNIVEFDENIFEAEEPGSGVEDRVIVEEMNDCIRKEMSRLAPHYYTVLILFFFEHMSIAEIADICGISVSAVKVRLHRGKNLLKMILSEGCNFYYDKNSNIRCVSKSPE
jgi:RNA polymerase sigma-70 factor (ECF subfamily)